MLAGLQPEVADVLGKVQKAASIDKAKNPNFDKEREVEIMVAHIQVNIYHLLKVPQNTSTVYLDAGVSWCDKVSGRAGA